MQPAPTTFDRLAANLAALYNTTGLTVYLDSPTSRALHGNADLSDRSKREIKQHRALRWVWKHASAFINSSSREPANRRSSKKRLFTYLAGQ